MLTANDNAGPIALKEAAYRATVRLDRFDIDVAGKRVPLQPDMTLHGDIILDKHTLMVWIFRPLMQTLRFGR
jgi:membrane fusion protein